MKMALPQRGWARFRTLLPTRADVAVMRRQPRRDLLAGLTVAVVALPLALGFGVSSGLGAAAGLATAIVAGVLAAVFGGSNLQVSGPTGAMTVVLVPIVASSAPAGCSPSACWPASILVALALARAGRFVRYVPAPVVEGFTAGIAVVIFLQQVPAALGVPAATGKGRGRGLAGRRGLLARPRTGRPSALAVGVAALMLLGARWRPTVPVLPARGRPRRPSWRSSAHLDGAPHRRHCRPACPRRRSASSTVGDLRRWLTGGPGGRGAGRAGEPAVGHRRRRHERRTTPRPRPGTVRPGHRQPGRAAVRRGPRHRGDRPYRGQRPRRRRAPGWRRSPTPSCWPSSCSRRPRWSPTSRSPRWRASCWPPRSAWSRSARCRAGPLHPLRRAGDGARPPTATVALDLVLAVGIGLVARVLPGGARGRPRGPPGTGAAGHRRPPRRGSSPAAEHIVAYRLDGPLFFAAAHRFLLELSDVADVRVVILRLSRVSTIDGTGALVLRDAIERLEHRGITVYLSGIPAHHTKALDALAVLDRLRAKRRVFAHTDEAITAARAALHDQGILATHPPTVAPTRSTPETTTSNTPRAGVARRQSLGRRATPPQTDHRPAQGAPVTVTRTELANHIEAAFASGPATRDTLLAYAASSHARPELIGVLQQLPNKPYPSIRDLWYDLSHVPVGR